jgi:methionine-rich copper-binding protein CopC
VKKTRLLSSLALSILVFALFVPPAQAHTEIVSSTPSPNQIVENMPAEVTLTFNEELISIEGQAVNFLTLRGTDGTGFEMINPAVSGAILSSTVGSGEYPAGKYILTYRAVSSDGHPVTGEISFATEFPTTIESSSLKPTTTAYLAEPAGSSTTTLVAIVGGLIFVLAIILGVRKRRGIWPK